MTSRYWFLVLLFSCLSISCLQANMASPNVYGYTPSVGLQSKDIDIVKEDLTIILSDTTNQAKYRVRYHIFNNKEEGQLLLVFDAVQSFSEFKVFLDGDPVELSSLESNSDSTEYLYKNYQQISLDVSRGEHTIDVYYVGYPSEFLGDWVTQYTYTYNLAPAKDWKSFGKLNLTIDATTLKDLVSIDIQDSVYQIQGTSRSWQFDSIPQDMLNIRFLPKGNLSFIIYPEFVFIVAFIILFVLNLWWSIKWRRSHLSKKYCLPSILGALLVPALSIAAYMFSYPLIDFLIGEHAARFHGYVFLVILTYPFFAILYFIIMWIIDHFYKRKLRSRQETLGNIA